jgi:hypothetical protein
VVKADLSRVEKDGRAIGFNVEGVPQTAKVNEDNTRVSIQGASSDPSELKAGQSCEITYAGNNQDALRVDCR